MGLDHEKVNCPIGGEDDIVYRNVNAYEEGLHRPENGPIGVVMFPISFEPPVSNH